MKALQLNMILIGILLIVSSCNDASKESVDAVCSDYHTMCEDGDAFFDTTDPNTCNRGCKEELESGEYASEACFFMACAVEVSLCDNEEEGDPTIIQCAEDHGWMPEIED